MKVVDIANEIFIDSGEPSNTSIPAISFWIRGKVGWMNTLLFEDMYVTDSLEIYDGGGSEISLEMVSVIKQSYRVYDLQLQINSSMTSLLSDGILSVSDNLAGTSFTRVNRNEIVKTLIMLRKDEMKYLDTMVHAYRSLKSVPSQVAGDDTYSGAFQNFPYYYQLSTRRY